jgi:F-type H+-transporting ATPase subunit a
MASDILHIKDSYYFDVPKTFWSRHYESPAQIAGSFPWFVRLDDDYQDWEADRFIQTLGEITGDPAKLESVKANWEKARHSHANHGKPLDRYLNDGALTLEATARSWATRNAPDARDPLDAYLAKHPGQEFAWVAQMNRDPQKKAAWAKASTDANSPVALQEYLSLDRAKWDQHKLDGYSKALSGKVFIPQVFGGQLRNAYEAETGFCVSRYMILEVAVAVIVLFAFRWLAGKVKGGAAPKGKLWNMLEGGVQFVRNQVVVPAMGDHDADRFLPLFLTLFFFILGCNLMGMIPFLGAPTAAFGTTLALAGIVFATSLGFGMKELGPVGFFANQAPHIDMPFGIGKAISFLILGIELLSFCIKHGILAVRLLANMVAGHLVLLAIMGIAFGVHAASMHTGTWSMVAVISIAGTTALSFLELFVCFLQAYVFTFLAALFVGSAIHHHH